MRQLTKDHTVAQAMADAGYIAPEEVRHHNKKNVLTNFLGGHHGKVKADVRWLRVLDGDRLLLCSDGLTDMVDDAAIASILGKHDHPEGAAQHLLDEALDRGGKDNVTIILAQYSVPGQTAAIAREADAHAPGLERPDRLGSKAVSRSIVGRRRSVSRRGHDRDDDAFPLASRRNIGRTIRRTASSRHYRATCHDSFVPAAPD